MKEDDDGDYDDDAKRALEHNSSLNLLDNVWLGQGVQTGIPTAGQ